MGLGSGAGPELSVGSAIRRVGMGGDWEVCVQGLKGEQEMLVV